MVLRGNEPGELGNAFDGARSRDGAVAVRRSARALGVGLQSCFQGPLSEARRGKPRENGLEAIEDNGCQEPAAGTQRKSGQLRMKHRDCR